MRRATSALLAMGTAFAAIGIAPVVTVTTAPDAVALDNGVALTPPMGFNGWNAFRCDVDEEIIKETADLIVSYGLRDAGYEYVNLDDCWMAPSRDADGRLAADPVKFPNGIEALADYVHGKGLKLGIYADAGTATCQGYPGSLGHETIDAQTFADWGVDYLKYDNCNNNGLTSREQFIARYSAMRDAILATGRPILYSICQWGVREPWTWAADIGNQWRTTGDIKDNWPKLKEIISRNAPLAPYAGPGAWNDPDMLQVGNGGMTDTEYRTHFSLWAVMAAPLIIGTDLRTANPETLAIFGNRDVIAVNQDPLGVQGEVIAEHEGTMVFNKPLANGDRAVALYNTTDASATISTTAAAVGLPWSPAYALDDLWGGETTQSAGTIAANVPAHGTVVYRVSAVRNWTPLAPAATQSVSSSSSYPHHGDIAMTASGATTVTSTLTNVSRATLVDVRVHADAPQGWTLSPSDSSTRRLLRTGESSQASWTLAAPSTAEPGEYPVTITATYAYTGGDTAVTRTHTAARVVPRPPRGAAGLSEIPWALASNGDGPVELDMSNAATAAGDGGPLSIRGQVYPRGLGTHSPSSIVYYLGGECSSLTTDVGIDDETGGRGLVSFQIYADDTKVADSGSVGATVPARTLYADLTGATWLRLFVDPMGTNDGANVSDHADWAGPLLTCA